MSRLTPEERDPKFLIDHDYLEQVKDFAYHGKQIEASRLGYRITPLFASHFLGRIFDTPSAVFPEEVLRPELQNIDYFADGVLNIIEAQEKVAKDYITDGSVEAAIPPLQAILHIMANGSWNGKKLTDPEVRKLFSREYVIQSDWYKARIKAYIDSEHYKLTEGIEYIKKFLESPHGRSKQEIQHAKSILKDTEAMLHTNRSPEYAQSLIGTIGLDPLFQKL
jgi:hypothetical protein